MTPRNPEYPVRLDVEYPDRLSRLLIFVKWLLAIPHFIALFVLGIGVVAVWVVSWFAVLITGRYPEGMFNFMVGVMRWGARASAYYLLLTDRYPPFSLEDDPSYPVRLQVDYPQHIARWRPLLNWLLVIPAFIALYVFLLIGYVAVVIGWFAILITGRLPQGLFNAVVVWMRWTVRINAFSYWMTERYPPFVWA
jgi:hypothetical protein